MRKVTEDIVARELLADIDIYWDGKRIDFDREVEIEHDVIHVKGSIDYTYSYEEDTNATTMTWVSVDIEECDVSRDEDYPGMATRVNEAFIKKYLEQYLIEL